MEIRRDNLRRWKIEIEMDGLSEPDVAEVYESVRKHFHLKRETFGTTNACATPSTNTEHSCANNVKHNIST